MMAFKEVIEQITDRKSNAMKVRSLLFAYGPAIYKKTPKNKKTKQHYHNNKNKQTPGKRWPQ